ncbi:shikimate dehydrogenase family protein [Fulvivirga lutea]|uniref:Shikimate dehydrogenase n=1 Tax=Fulvivirga lutea TaxID=2810512 RepID=A0A975A0M4_9BACT|nr:shikimate dehydrogenase [Fulvivirga lutea]QSE97416.1 shikimate dehydrogenase [Fulvivirga lutea]
MTRFGLIGKTLSHSFSQKYFTQKFQELGLKDHQYDLFELSTISEVEKIFKLSELKGLNVTVPYKQSVLPYLNQLDDTAQKVGAVNVIKLEKGRKIGFNSDYLGFKKSLEQWLPQPFRNTALVLGTGGASKAVECSLKDLGIDYQLVSRNPSESQISYEYVNELIHKTKLIINTTPLGMAPEIDNCPDLDYNQITSEHYLYDLVYNPEETLFLAKGKSKGASIKNGLEMLHLQAEESWKIWNK